MYRLIKYVRQYYRPASGAVLTEPSSYIRDGHELPAVIFRPAGMQKPLPAWIVLHGMTYHGPRHPGLQRFASALAAAGHVVFVPEIVEWTRLRVSPQLTGPTISASAATLSAYAHADRERVGAFGFSFGATQALASASTEQVAQHVKAIVAWGGYADLMREVEFGMTGDHEWDGIHEHIDPDPYARWIFGGNYLTSVPEFADLTAVAAALMELALAAGRSGTFAGDPMHDPLKISLAQRFTGRERDVYELFAPTGAHDLSAAVHLARKLAIAIRVNDPLMEPAPRFGGLRVPCILTHGREDRVVPYTETLRMQRMLPPAMIRATNVTSLFAHSGSARHGLRSLDLAREAASFGSVINRILKTL